LVVLGVVCVGAVCCVAEKYGGATPADVVAGLRGLSFTSVKETVLGNNMRDMGTKLQAAGPNGKCFSDVVSSANHCNAGDYAWGGGAFNTLCASTNTYTEAENDAGTNYVHPLHYTNCPGATACMVTACARNDDSDMIREGIGSGLRLPMFWNEVARGNQCCSGTSIWEGQSSGEADCASKCENESECRYYSFWHTGGGNYCKLTSSCDSMSQSANHDVSVKRNENVQVHFSVTCGKREKLMVCPIEKGTSNIKDCVVKKECGSYSAPTPRASDSHHNTAIWGVNIGGDVPDRGFSPSALTSTHAATWEQVINTAAVKRAFVATCAEFCGFY